jgi:myo-inositol-1(or 4)-monophosphatase
VNLAFLKQEVIYLSEQVGDFIRHEVKMFSRLDIEFKGKNNMVSYVDKEAERMIVSRLQHLLPESGFIAEEGSGEKVEGGYNWVVDPLDGTTNFVHGIPIYSISIALMHADEILLGVVYDPNNKECFHAVRGGGAWLGEQPIHISPVTEMSECLIATGFPYRLIEKMPQYLALLYEFIKRTHGFRRMGSAAIDLAYVACGRFEGFYEHSLKPWDVAAGALLIQEAGGKVSDLRLGNDYIFGGEILAAGHIHQEMWEVIREYFLKD